jgi:hypothetical protein
MTKQTSKQKVAKTKPQGGAGAAKNAEATSAEIKVVARPSPSVDHGGLHVLFPRLPELAVAEYAALKASIADKGILVPVVRTEQGQTIDGRARKKIAAELGLRNYPVRTVSGLTEEQRWAGGRPRTGRESHFASRQGDQAAEDSGPEPGAVETEKRARGRLNGKKTWTIIGDQKVIKRHLLVADPPYGITDEPLGAGRPGRLHPVVGSQVVGLRGGLRCRLLVPGGVNFTESLGGRSPSHFAKGSLYPKISRHTFWRSSVRQRPKASQASWSVLQSFFTYS